MDSSSELEALGTGTRVGRIVARLDVYRRQFGLAYVLLLVVRALVDRALVPLDAYLLRREGERAVLGPAHRAYRGHSPMENREQWAAYDWSARGEEWGNQEGGWALIKEHLEPLLPQRPVIVEIGPGGGRWSSELVRMADRLTLVDVTEAAVEICRQRFRDAANVEVVQTDGASLPGVPSATVDVVWSMEAFVHMAPVDVVAYIGEIARVLKPNGFALIHHAARWHRPGWRAPMTRELFARLAQNRGLIVQTQFDQWAAGRFNVHASHDAITILRRPYS